MTKINGSGQLEWTFEELDLDGALLVVMAEIDRLDILRNHFKALIKTIDIYSDFQTWEFVSNERIRLAAEWLKFNDVRRGIQTLLHKGDLLNG